VTALAGQVLHLDWRGLARLVEETVGQVDALIVDAPYSERTHAGHDEAAESMTAAVRGADYRSRVVRPGGGTGPRRSISYNPWSDEDVGRFVAAWVPLTSGWFVSITDHVLARSWEAHLASAGLYVFAPIACVEPGSRCRLVGDGPAQWSTFAVVARPRNAAWIKRRASRRKARGASCALPGAYVAHERGKDVPGGKPIELMESIVDDYSEPGDLVCDPCCGAGTTLLAAQLLGRRWVGSDMDRDHAALARERLRRLPAAPRRGTLALPWPEEP